MKNNKKIVIVAAVFPPEPVVSANMAMDIATRLSSEDGNVVVLSPRPSRPLGYNFVDDNTLKPFEHIIIKSYVCPRSNIIGRLMESISFGLRTARYIESNKDDIKVIYADTWPLFAQFFLSRAALRNKIPLLMHIQDVYPDSLSKKFIFPFGNILQLILQPLDRYILKCSTGLVGISPNMINYLSQSRRIEFNKFVLVRNWQNDDVFKTSYRPIDTNNRRKVFMFLGSINPTASVDVLIKAFAKSKIKNADIVILGNGPDKIRCKELASSLDVNVFFGEVASSCVPYEQQKADILLLPLKKGISYTATPSKLTAYLFSGRPVIACVEADSDVANILYDAQCGSVVQPENVDLLAEELVKYNNMSDVQLNQKGKNAFLYAEQFLSKEKNLSIITNKILEYENL